MEKVALLRQTTRQGDLSLLFTTDKLGRLKERPHGMEQSYWTRNQRASEHVFSADISLQHNLCFFSLSNHTLCFKHHLTEDFC